MSSLYMIYHYIWQLIALWEMSDSWRGMDISSMPLRLNVTSMPPHWSVQKDLHLTDKMQSISFPVNNGRPVRANCWKAGAIAQLKAVSKQIQKPTEPQQVQQPMTCISEDALDNVMAPPLKKKWASKVVSTFGIHYEQHMTYFTRPYKRWSSPSMGTNLILLIILGLPNLSVNCLF